MCSRKFRLLVFSSAGMFFCCLNVQAQPAEFWKLVDSSGYYMHNNYNMAKAIGFAESAKELALKLYGEDNVWYATSDMLLAKAYFFSRDYKNAILFGEKSTDRLKRLVENGSTDTLLYYYSDTLLDLAQIYSDSKMNTKAEEACTACINANPSPDSNLATPYSVYSYLMCQKKLADMYFVNGKKVASVSLYEKCIKIMKDDFVKNPTEQQETGNMICATLNNLGFVHNDMGNEYLAELALKDACYYGEKALPVSAGAYNSALINLATTLTMLNQFEEAQVYFKKAEDINSKLNEEYGLATLKGNMASLLKNLTFQERKELRLQSLNLYRKTNSLINAGPVLEGLAEDCIQLGDFENAKKYLAEADSIHYQAHKEFPNGNITELRSILAMAQDQPEEALRLNESAISKYPANNRELTKVWFHRAIIFARLGRMKESQSAWAKVHDGLSRDMKTNLPYLSENQLEQYIDNDDNYRAQFLSFVCSNIRTQQENGAVYDLLLNAKGALLDRERQMKRDVGSTIDTLLIKKHNQFIHNRTMLARYNQAGNYTAKERIDSLEKETEVLEKEISRTLPASQYREYKWKNVQAALKPKEAAIEIIRFRLWDEKKKTEKLFGEWRDSVYYAALVLLPDSKAPHLILLPDGRAMEAKHLQAYRTDMDRRSYDSDSYQTFWAPFAELLKNTKTVYFSPDGVYHQISLGTLRNIRTGRFLSEEMDIHFVGSTRTLTKSKKRNVSQNTIALFGFPDYQKANEAQNMESPQSLSYIGGPELDRGDNYFSPLPGTKKEVESIHKIATAKGWTSQLFTEQQASEENLKKIRNATVLHIATHGYFLKDTSKTVLTKRALLNSGLVLAGALDSSRYHNVENEDGLLTAYEATDLPLENTQLVTLSACETGLGLIRNGNGVYGLPRAFLAAGAESVLMSLWRVNDQVTNQLMGKFYQYWMGGISKQAALLKAQEDIRNTSETLSHPYYWGGFVLTER